MSLELTVLIAFIGLLTMTALLGNNGPRAAFINAGPSLGARLEVDMTTGRCFSLPKGSGGSGACSRATTWE